MAIAEINGIELYYESHGPSEGDAPTIVFLHGGSGNHLSWWQQVPYFRESHRCLTLDQRGFGRSTDPEGLGYERAADDVEALLDHLGIERSALVAQSAGGIAALGFAARSPERVSALVMAATWGFPSDWLELLEQAMQHRAETLKAHGPAALVLAPSFPRAQPAAAFLYSEVGALNRQGPPPPPRPPGRPRLEDMPSSGVTKAEMGALRVPTLFLVGSEDAQALPEVMRQAHEFMPGSEYVEVAGCGHSVYWEDAEAFNEAVGAFLLKHT
jgi:pimeloyl-ACP methyl ester carboxylesterase